MVLIFTPIPGEMIQFDEHIFQMELKPPTNNFIKISAYHFHQNRILNARTLKLLVGVVNLFGFLFTFWSSIFLLLQPCFVGPHLPLIFSRCNNVQKLQELLQCSPWWLFDVRDS